MSRIAEFVVILGLTNISICDIGLRIFRNTEENYTPVMFAVQEKVGANLSLSCELWSSVNDNTVIDDQITWGKASLELSFKDKEDLELLIRKKSKLLYSLIKQSDVNKAVKNFAPLKFEDQGTYFCTSFKYMLFEIIHVVVNDDTRRKLPFQQIDGVFNMESCNENMFQCVTNGICINQHYVCDGKRDCTDGSDESVKTCNGDPCRDKLACEDGRCIPSSWCCDRFQDSSCTVIYRPRCCQILSESYEDFEYGYIPYNMTQVKPTGTRYLFISFCILATFFSVVLMLLILSKVFIFANKTSCGHPRNLFQLEEMTVRPHELRSNVIRDGYRNRLILSNVRYVGDCESGNEVSDPLITLSPVPRSCRTYVSDQPPSYSEVVDNQGEPPPPYTSREFLNVPDGTTNAT